MATVAWDGWDKIGTLLVQAGADVSPAVAVVRRGVPTSVPKEMIRYWYLGTEDSPFAPGHTFSRTQVGIKLMVAVFLPMAGAGSPASEEALDDRIELLDAAIQSALWSDTYLGNPDIGTNSAIGIEITGSDADVVQVGTGWVRSLEIPVTYAIADRHTIAR